MIKRKIIFGKFVLFVLLYQNVFASTDTADALSGLGVNINGYLTFVLQCSPRRNISNVPNKFQEVFDGAFLGVLYATKHVTENSLIRTHFRVTKGVGINDKFLLYSSLDSCVDTNSDLTNGFLELAEVLWEQNLFNKKLTIDFGRLNPTLYLT